MIDLYDALDYASFYCFIIVSVIISVRSIYMCYFSNSNDWRKSNRAVCVSDYCLYSLSKIDRTLISMREDSERGMINWGVYKLLLYRLGNIARCDVMHGDLDSYLSRRVINSLSRDGVIDYKKKFISDKR